MTKKLKNIALCMFGMLAILLAGVFFVGCGVNYEKISLTVNNSSLELQLGEQHMLTFKIEGYQNGFSNRVKVTNNQTDIFTTTAPKYVGNDTIEIGVTGLAGGNGELAVTTLEANKTCTVQVHVHESSSFMTKNQNLMYVSQRTPFVPTSDFFDFAAHTTDKNLSYYYIKTGNALDIDLNTYLFVGIEEGENPRARFSKGVDERSYEVVQFDKICLEETESGLKLVGSFLGENVELENSDAAEKFKILTSYNRAYVAEEDPILFDVSDVYVLRDIDVKVSGGYLKKDEFGSSRIEQIDGTRGFVDVDSQPITIVPNRRDFVQYILKVKVGQTSATGLGFNISKSNDSVVADFFDEDANWMEKGENIYYISISQNSLKENSAIVSFNVFYEVAKDVGDQSVNLEQKYTVNTEIAPSAITINGVTDPAPLTLYNGYNDRETDQGFGWQYLYFDVISNFQSIPTYQGIYFEYDEDNLDFRTFSSGAVVRNNNKELPYTDLSTPFKVRGKLGVDPTDLAYIKVYVLLSGVLENVEGAPSAEISCSIKAGPRNLDVVDSRYNDTLYVDFEQDNIDFSEILWADNEFQTVTVRRVEGNDVVNIIQDDTPWTLQGGRYLLNLKLSPKAVGSGKYELVLDNGVSKELTFECRKFLKESTTSVVQVPYTGNSAASNTALNLEILNPSTSTGATYGNSATFEIFSNAENITFGTKNNIVDIQSVNSTSSGKRYVVTTLANGNATITFTLSGRVLSNDQPFLLGDVKNIEIVVFVSSYSLIDEFYLSNAGSRAISRDVYFGSTNISDEDSMIEYTAVANFEKSNNFFQKTLNISSLQKIFDGFCEEGDDGTWTVYTADYFNQMFSDVLVYEGFDKKFISFSVIGDYGYSPEIYLDGKIVRKVGSIVDDKKVRFIFNGTMFSLEKEYVFDIQEDGEDVQYVLTFDNLVFDINTYGRFDFESFTYTNTAAARGNIVLSAELRQPNKTNRFDANISINEYAAVESISLSTPLEQIDFSSFDLSQPVGVYTYPTISTNSEIRVQFVPTNNNPYASMVQYEIDKSNASNGIYTVILSCENFYNKHSGKEYDENSYRDDDDTPIEEIEKSLTGNVYIFPAEWGSSYTLLVGDHRPIKISVHFRNGSEENPFILEDAEDVAKINTDETTLRSHYEIRSRISLATTAISSPIGIVDGELIGFSGTILGTSSQAEISDVTISGGNLCQVCKNDAYAGLFAKINPEAKLENFSVSGRFSLSRDFAGQDLYAGLLAAQNFGSLTNVGVKIASSEIGVQAKNLYFGGIAGVNYGEIVQDFTLFDGSGYIYHQYGEVASAPEFVAGIGRVKKIVGTPVSDDILGRCVLVNGTKIRVDDNGFAIDEQGRKIKYDQNDQILPDFRDFEGQLSKNLAYFNDELQISNSAGNIFAGGIVGINVSKIQKIAPKISSYRLYGYTGYSAYAQISVTNASGKVALGGGVGVLAYGSTSNVQIPNLGTSDATNSLSGLLVGGRLSSIMLPEGVTDYVGGLAGYVSTAKVKAIDISQNTVRTFVHGMQFVGGIVGYEDFTIGDDFSIRANYSENVFDAVDDGMSGLLASAIVRLSNEDMKAKIQNGDVPSYMIGNSYSNGRDFDSEIKHIFDVGTYVMREYVSQKLTNLGMASGTRDNYYGDLVLVERNQTAGTWTFNIALSKKFTQKYVELSVETSPFEMDMDATGLPENFKKPLVYFMNYFDAEDDLTGRLGANAREEIQNLNRFTPNMTEFYPFVLSNSEVSISSSSSQVLEIDINGNIVVHSDGIATITLSSILNSRQNLVIYIYVVNFFNKDISSSIFYATPVADGTGISSGKFTIYGNSYISLYISPNYYLPETRDVDGNLFSVSPDGILNYKNVGYILSKNTQLTAQENSEGASEDERFSSADIVKQQIMFSKNTTPKDGKIDKYEIVPILQTKLKIDGKEYVFYKILEKQKTNLEISYSETATRILTKDDEYTMATNEVLNENVYITTTNAPEKELLFYEIDKNGDISFKQSRAPFNSTFAFETDEDFLKYLNGEAAAGFSGLDDALFELKFGRISGTNNFTFSLKINKNSSSYKNRFEKPIAGRYVFHFYASNINSENAVSWSFAVNLVEAKLNYVTANNYHNIQDISTPNKVIEPGTKGLLEINLNPIDAVFDRFTISNDAINDLPGAGKAQFAFAYRTNTGFVESETFGSFDNGHLLNFTYQELLTYLSSLGEEYFYNGKIYVSYFLASKNVEDNVPVRFNIAVNPMGETYNVTSVVELTTKIGNFARFDFADKEMIGDKYYVARGLSYDLSLKTYGFEQEQVVVSVGEFEDVALKDLANGHDFGYISISGQDGKYVLKITSGTITYNSGLGCELEIVTTATKTVDKVKVTSVNSLKICIMEYVLDYEYVSGKNEDLVEGVEDGVVNIAVGNPFTPKLNIFDFLEYDATNASVVSEVETFMNEMTQSIAWTVVWNGDEFVMQETAQPLKTEYFYLNGMNITPTKVYNPSQNLYHFTMNGYYRMFEGRYVTSSANALDANRIYTEFVFNVHDQSTKDSPIPIYDYDDLLKMQAEGNGGWYILLRDIVIPNAAYCASNGMQNFAPLNVSLAGLDGNGYAFQFSGVYNFDSSNVGLFATVSDSTVLQNVKIELSDDVYFRINNSSYNVGLLAAENNGIITNAQTEALDNASLTITSSQTVTDAYVAGLVAQNNGTITNSRTGANIVSTNDLSGFVAQNTGKIVSSYFRGASLKNTASTTQERTAGFVIENSGEILTSYVSGDMSKDVDSGGRPLKNEDWEFYIGGTSCANSITSGNNVAGFAYTNNGNISDCYSNIYLFQNGTAAGFVFENSHNIERCFSTSVLGNKNTESFGFAQQNSWIDADSKLQNGTIKDCYFLRHKNQGVNDKYPDINYSIENLEDDENADISELDIPQFQFKIDENGEMSLPEPLENGKIPFENYVVAKGRDNKSVWFYNADKYDDRGFNGSMFNTGRVELVAPNIKAESVRELYDTQTVVDEETGAEFLRYSYIYKVGTASLGSEYNPIIVSNAEDFETYMKREVDINSNNFSHFRFVGDVDFSEYSEIGTTYDVNFMGYLEGNFMSIEGVALLSNKPIVYAGLFGKIGGAKNASGTLMNFSYTPNAVNFTKGEVVGALAGRLDGGTLINITLETNSTEQDTIVGNNIVGGLLGMTAGNFKIKNVHSDFGAVARNLATIPQQEALNPNDGDFSKWSFAGSFAGALTGNGKIEDIDLSSSVSVMGRHAGLLFGYVGEGVNVSNVDLQISNSMVLNGYSYAGFVAGQSAGNFENVHISGTTYDSFREKPYVPDAVGGFAGLLSGGNLEEIIIKQNFVLSTESSSAGIESVGGVAGELDGNASMHDVTVEGKIVGFKNVGGVVGKISGGVSSFVDMNVNVNLQVLCRAVDEISIGGLAGLTSRGAIVNMKASKSDYLDSDETFDNELNKQKDMIKDLDNLQVDADKFLNVEDLPISISRIKAQIEAVETEKHEEEEKGEEKDEALIERLEGQIASLQADLNAQKARLKDFVNKLNELAKKEEYREISKGEDIVELGKDGETVTKKENFNPVYSKLNAAIAEKVWGLAEKANRFDVSASAHAYIYAEEGRAFMIDVGALIGRNNNAAHEIVDTYSLLHGAGGYLSAAEIEVDNIAISGGKDFSSTAVVTKDAQTGELSIERTEIGQEEQKFSSIVAMRSRAVRSYSFFNVAFKQNAAAGKEYGDYQTNLNIFGSIFLPKEV